MRYKNKLTNFAFQKYSVHFMLNRFKLLLSILLLFFFQNFGFSQCNNLQANAGPDVFLCAGSSGVQLNGTATGGSGGYTFSWTLPSGNPAPGLSCNNCANPIANAPGTYLLIVTTTPNCTNTSTVVVTNSNSPTANFTFTPNNACGNLPVQFTNSSTGNGLTYSWNFGDPTSGNNTSTASNPTHTFSATGAANVNYNVTLTVTNSNGCSSTSTQVVTVKPLPVSTLVDYAFDFKNCDGTSFNMTVNESNTSAGIANFQIQWGDGTADFSGPTFPAAGITHTYTTQEIFNLTYTLTGANGCTNTYTQIVSNITNPSIGAANPGGTNGCGPLQICFPLSNYANNHPSTTYRVNFGDGSPILNLPHPPPSVLCHTYTTSSCGFPGNAFTFRMKAINLCDSSEATITPIRVYSPPTANFSNPAAACTNSSVAFTNLTTGSYTSSCSSASTFVWNFGDGTSTVTVNSTATQLHTFSAPGTYTVTLTASNVTCGSSTITRLICIENPPIPLYVISQNQGCVPFTSQVTNSSTSLNTCAVATAWAVTFNGNSCNNSSGSFSYVGGTSASSFSPNFQFNSPGTYSIQYSMTNSCGTFTSTKAITAQSSPLIAMNTLSTICAGQSANPAATFNSCYETIDTYNWTFTNGTPATSSLSNPPTVTFNTPGNQIISLQATNACGTASASTSILVNPIPPLLNPTVNSPVCVGSSAFFSATSVTGVVYHWSGPNGFSTTQQNFQINNITTNYSGTYSVYGTIGNCQGPTQSVNLIVNPLPIVSAGSDFSICQNAVPVTLGGSPAGGNWSGFGVSGGILTPFNAGNYTLTYNYTNPSTGCSAIDYASVTVNPVPLTNAGIDQTFCNQPIPNTLTGSPAGGTWTGAGITNPTGQFTPTSNGTFPVVYTSTNIYGCIRRDTMIITVVNPSPVNAGSNQTVCANDANVQLIGGPVNGTWTGTGVTSAGLFDPTVAGTFPMVYSLGGGSCQTTDTMLFIVNPIPVVNAGANFNICIDAPIYSLTASTVGGTWTGTGIVGNTFNPLTAGVGTFNLTYTFTDAITNCTNFDVVSVTVVALPVVNAGADLSLCNQPIGVTLTGATPSGGVWSGSNVSPLGVFTPNGEGVFTLTYTFTNASGCVQADQIDVTVIDAQLANAGLDQAICINSQSLPVVGTPATGTWSGPGITAAGIFNPNTAGNFNLVYTYGGGTCLTRDTMIFTVHALPVVDAGPDVSICISAAPINFLGTPAGGTWSGSGITNANLGTFNPALLAAGAYPIVYSYTDPVTTCVNTNTLIVTVRPLPVPNFTYNPIVCGNVVASYTNTSTLGSTYAWDFGDGGTSTLTSPTHTFTTTGFTDVQLIVTSAFGCVDSITHNVEIQEPPLADFTLTPDSTCAPVVVNFTNLSSGIAPVYNWNFGNGTTSNLQNPPAVTYFEGYLADTTYYVTLNVSNFCGSVNHTETVIAMPKPKSIFGTNLDFGCSPFTLQIANVSLGLPDSFYWDFGDGTTSTDPSPFLSHIFTTGLNDTVYTIMLVATNECGIDTSYYDITVYPNIVTAFFNTDYISGCAPLAVEFTQYSVGANVYNWDFGDFNSSNSYNTSHVYTQAGTYTVSLMVTDGCSYDTATIDIVVIEPPVVDFVSAPDSVCINQPFTFTNLSTGSLSSTNWDFGDGTTSVTTNTQHAYFASGTYQVTLTGTSTINSCTASVTKPVVVRVNPVAAFTPNPLSGCVPLTVSFANQSTSTNFQTWDFGDGNFSTQFSPTHTFTSVGAYVVKLLVQNTNGCLDSISKVINVYPVPTANFTVTPTSSCTVPIDVVTTNLSTGAVNFNWNFGNGNFSSLTNPVITYNNPGIYTIQLTASNAYGCSDSHSFTVNIYGNPVADFIISRDTICLGETVVFISQSINADSVVWYVGDGNTFTGNTFPYQYGLPGVYDVSAIAYGPGGCSDTMTALNAILVNPKPIAGFDYINVQDPEPLSGTIEFTNTSIGATDYLWHFGNAQSSTELNPIYRYNTYGDFLAELIVTNQFGCKDTIDQIVIVEFFSGLFVPNAIYPDHPAFGVANFLPKGIGLASYEVLIYDDWGNLIWESRALDAQGRPTEYWDGKFNGARVQQDAYVWKITATFIDTKAWRGKEYEDGKFRKSGTVTVIR